MESWAETHGRVHRAQAVHHWSLGCGTDHAVQRGGCSAALSNGSEHAAQGEIGDEQPGRLDSRPGCVQLRQLAFRQKLHELRLRTPFAKIKVPRHEALHKRHRAVVVALVLVVLGAHKQKLE